MLEFPQDDTVAGACGGGAGLARVREDARARGCQLCSAAATGRAEAAAGLLLGAFSCRPWPHPRPARAPLPRRARGHAGGDVVLRAQGQPGHPRRRARGRRRRGGAPGAAPGGSWLLPARRGCSACVGRGSAPTHALPARRLSPCRARPLSRPPSACLTSCPSSQTRVRCRVCRLLLLEHQRRAAAGAEAAAAVSGSPPCALAAPNSGPERTRTAPRRALRRRRHGRRGGHVRPGGGAGAARPLRHRDVHVEPQAGGAGARPRKRRRACGGRAAMQAGSVVTRGCAQRVGAWQSGMHAGPFRRPCAADASCPALCRVPPCGTAGPGLPHPVRLHRPRVPAAQGQRATGGCWRLGAWVVVLPWVCGRVAWRMGGRADRQAAPCCTRAPACLLMPGLRGEGPWPALLLHAQPVHPHPCTRCTPSPLRPLRPLTPAPAAPPLTLAPAGPPSPAAPLRALPPPHPCSPRTRCTPRARRRWR